MSAPQRAGFEQAGAPSGAGSQLSVRRALAIGGQVVRVVFSSEPLHQSTAGLGDARNGANYAVTVIQGSGQPVRALSVSPAALFYPAYGVLAAGEVACDLQVDRPLIVGLTYQVAVSRNVVSASGSPIGVPYVASFAGATRPALTRQTRRQTQPVDLASDPFKGGIIVQAGDWASQSGLDSTKKRVWRIPMTGLGAFIWLPNFGLQFDIKKPGTLSRLSSLRTDLKQQLQAQPDVVASSSSASLDARGYLTLTINAQTSSGDRFSNTVTFSNTGGIVVQ